MSKRAAEFSGKRYADLSTKQQEQFLSYPLAVDQLVNANEDDVLEVFARLNYYTVTLNPAEKRHARYQGDFKWSVRKASRRWADLLKKILTTKQRVRMLDDSLTAEALGILLLGVSDGGQPKITTLYKTYDKTFGDSNPSVKNLDTVLSYFDKTLAPYQADTPLMQPPHFLMLFAALAAIMVGVPQGQLTQKEHSHPKAVGKNLGVVRENLLNLGSVIANDEEPAEEAYVEFWKASRSSTHRIASRRIRFPLYARALGSVSL
ncbi:MAG: hypothetical protein IPJ98_16275 [Bryobacterales bacterium]|nr:hypothetical protein [Bryobacterales bacterium]